MSWSDPEFAHASALLPGDAEAVREIAAAAKAEDCPLEIAGNGTKRASARPVDGGRAVSLAKLSGIELYEPEELVLSAFAGTKLAEIAAATAARGQHLAFEPPDFGPLYGGLAGDATIGGIVACNLSGPRRVRAGAARDHLLGFHGVNGLAQIFKSGGRVVKNVTGYDLGKLMAGSMGTLAILTQLTLKVMPCPESEITLIFPGLDQEAGLALLRAALGSAYDVSGAAFVPAAMAGRLGDGEWNAAFGSLTALRLEGPAPSVEARAAGLASLAERAPERVAGARFWRGLGDGAGFVNRGEGLLWRISVPPSAAHWAGLELAASGLSEQIFDWGGGLIWAGLPERAPALKDSAAAAVARALAPGGGHAWLVRRSPQAPLPPSVVIDRPEIPPALTMRIKSAFDPQRILNPGRMWRDI